MTSEEKQKQEFHSFRNIPDSFKKIVIVLSIKQKWIMKYLRLSMENSEKIV